MVDSILITVSGPPASGTSTLSNFIANEIDADVISGGDIFYELADEENMTPSEFSKLAEDDPSYDKQIDDRLKDIVQNYESKGFDRLVVDSRLAGWHAEDMADLKIYLKAPLSVRANRIDDRNETVAGLRIREQSEQQRYMEYYGIDIQDLSIYDVVIDTDTFSEKTINNLVTEILSNY